MSGLFRRLPARWVVIPLVVIAALVWTAVTVLPEGGTLSVSVLDVGEGDAILVTAPAGQHILIDGGPSPERVCLELGKALLFWERTIDVVVLTHPHSDHVTGLVEVLRRYEVGQVLYPEGIDYESSVYSEWLHVVEERGIDCTRANYYSRGGRCVGDTTAVGSYPSGASPYGALDMAGNVLEWVADWYDPDYYASSPDRNPQGPTASLRRVLRGGSFSSLGRQVRAAYRHDIDPSSYGEYHGFRCALSITDN